MKVLQKPIIARKFIICLAVCLLVVCAALSPDQLTDAQALAAELQQTIDNRSQPPNQKSSYTQNDNLYYSNEKEKKEKSEDMKEIKMQGDADAQFQLATTDDNDSVWGSPFQFAILNPVQLFPDTWNVYGLRTNVIYGKNQDIYGLDLGFLTNRANNLTGIQIAGAMNRVSESVRGIQIVAFANNVFNADMTGIQIGFGNAAKNLTGIQFGCCAEATDSSTGIQFGGIFTKTDNLKGLQFGFANMAEKGVGVQLGIGNVSTSMSGLQIGLINVMKNGFLPVFPIINFSVSRNEETPPAEDADALEKSEAVKETGTP